LLHLPSLPAESLSDYLLQASDTTCQLSHQSCAGDDSKCCGIGKFYDATLGTRTVTVNSVDHVLPFVTHADDLDNGCVLCPFGTYKTTVGMHAACTLCPTGTITLAEGSISEDDCVTCPAGTEITIIDDSNSRSQCITCSSAQISSQGITCQDCPLGKVSDIIARFLTSFYIALLMLVSSQMQVGTVIEITASPSP